MPRRGRVCMGDGSVGGERRRGMEGARSGGAEDTGGSREEDAGRRGTEDSGRRVTMVVVDKQTGEEVADGVGHAATVGADNGGKKGGSSKSGGMQKEEDGLCWGCWVWEEECQ